jgi:hypothetical protein
MTTYGLGHPKNENIHYNIHIIKPIKTELKKVRKSGGKGRRIVFAVHQEKGRQLFSRRPFLL